MTIANRDDAGPLESNQETIMTFLRGQHHSWCPCAARSFQLWRKRSNLH